MKRLLILELMIALCQSVFAYDFSAIAPSGQTLYYDSIGDHRVRVVKPISGTSYPYASGDLIIPDTVTYEGVSYMVVEIDEYAFYGCASLTSVVFPLHLWKIGMNSFRDLVGITSITLPPILLEIGYGAFAGTGITSVEIPNSVMLLDARVFFGCNQLTSAVISSSINHLGAETFYGCSNLTTISLPNSITSIGQMAFKGCSSLTSIELPTNLTSIGSYAFNNCSNLTNVTLPSTLTEIERFAFAGCSSINSIVIPANVSEIEYGAFSDCGSLNNLSVSEDNSVYDSRNSCNAIIQTDLNILIQGCNTTIIPDDIISIQQYAFSGCHGLSHITIPLSVASIGYNSFENCTNLSSLVIPASVVDLQGEAFGGCSSLDTVIIRSPITTINRSMFKDCSSLKHIEIPNTVTTIGEDAFKGCRSLNLVIPSSVTSIQGFYTISETKSIHCKAEIPPVLYAYPGDYSRKTDIYVPCGSVANYQSAEKWSFMSSKIKGTPFVDYSYHFYSNNNAMGSVRVSVPDCDTNIKITAEYLGGYKFVHWSDGNTENPRTIHLTKDTSLIAFFEKGKYAVVGVSDEQYGYVLGSDTVYRGDTVVLTAIAKPGYTFSCWYNRLGILYSTDNPLSVVAQSYDCEYTAIFTTDESWNEEQNESDTVYIYVDVPTHDTIYIQVPIHDTSFVYIRDTIISNTIHNDTTLINIYDTTYYNIYQYDTTFITINDTIINRIYQYDTTIVNININDTTINNHFYYDTIVVNNYRYDTVSIYYHDTVTNTYYDTIIISHYYHDTILVNNYIYDTIYLNRYIFDTIYLYDTLYLGIEDADLPNARIYQHNGNIIVDGTEGNTVVLYDAIGRQIATRREDFETIRFEIPTSGVYLIKIGDLPARRVVVVR